MPRGARRHVLPHRAAGFSPTIVQEASGISALGLVAAGLGVTIVADSYRALSLDGVRFVPVSGHQLTLQLAWAADNANTALAGFLDTARQTMRHQGRRGAHAQEPGADGAASTQPGS